MLSQSINDIDESAREQSSAINQINVAVSQIDVMTQQNSATASDTSNVADILALMAQKLVAEANSKNFVGK